MRASRSTPISLPSGPLYNVRLLPARPAIRATTKITRKRKNSIFAMPAEAAATPPKPNTAAMIAVTKNTRAQ